MYTGNHYTNKHGDFLMNGGRYVAGETISRRDTQ